jgi:hypothetical protein
MEYWTRNLKIITIITASLLLFFGCFIYVNKVKINRPISHDKIEGGSTLDYQSKIISEIKKIDQNNDMGSTTKNLLILDKIATITLVRGDSDPTKLQESSKDILGIYRNIYINSASDQNIKDEVLASYIRFFVLHGFSPYFSNNVPVEFLSLFNKYRSIGYTNRLATMLMFSDMSNMVSEKNTSDILLLSSRTFNNAMILRTYPVKLKMEDREIILNNIRKDLPLLKSNKAIFFNAQTPVILEPLFAYAIGEDMLQKYEPDHKKTNEEIDKIYEDTIEKLSTLQNIDETSLKHTRIFVTFWYLDSINRRYKENLNKKREEELVNLALSDINSSKILQDTFYSYFKYIPQSGNAFWERVTYHFYVLSKKYPQLKEYLEKNKIQLPS